MMAEWSKLESGGDDSINVGCMMLISRPCPNCKTMIEKNDGCRHMNCTNCQFHFCWDCMQKVRRAPGGHGIDL